VGVIARAVMLAALCVACVPHETGAVSGTLLFERLAPRDDLKGLAKAAPAPAEHVPFTIARGDRVLARGVTGVGGSFTARVGGEDAAGAMIVFEAVARDGDAGAPIVAVGRAGAKPVVPWTWTRRVPRGGTLGAITVSVAEGAGALQAFRTVVFTRAWALRTFVTLGPRYRRAPSIGVLWAPGVHFPSTAYDDALAGGVDIGGEHYDTRIVLDGSAATDAVWTESLLDHELGHMVMDVYGVIPEYDTAREAMLNDPEPPPIAWAEGWATFCGQVARSARDGVERPIAIFQDAHEQYSLDLRNGALAWPANPRASVALPDPARDQTQPVADALVSTILWNLRAAIGERAVLAALGSLRGDRGAHGLDLVDLLDALACAGVLPDAVIKEVVRGRFGFPYDGTPRCS
jgi:hypothetical protein